MDNLLSFQPASLPGGDPARRHRPDVEPLWREVIGEELKAERNRRGERIVDVAQRAGVVPQYLSELERGKKDPSSEVLAALAGALEISVLNLTGRASRRLASTHQQGTVCLAA